MRVVPALALASLVTAAVPSLARAEGSASWLRAYMSSYGSARSSGASHALIPAWARKYNMNCSGCHYPAAPRLNAVGIKFRWAGYRMPEEMGEKTDVNQLSNYLAVRARMRDDYAKTENQNATNSFSFNDVTLFYAGAFGKNFAGYLELEREPTGEVGLVSNLLGVWGKESSYRGFRAGQMHWLLRDGVAGFDRPTGIRTPTPLSGALTGGTNAIPFTFSTDQLGAEWFFVTGRNRVSAEVLNGIRPDGSAGATDTDPEKDFVVTDQYLLDERGSGITAVGYFGTVKGVNVGDPTLRSHFLRVGLSANKIVNNFEVLGGFVWGKDRDLPLATADISGMGYWVTGQYMFPKSSLTVFGRYEFVDPNTDVDDNGATRFVLGGVIPIGLPEYLRFAIEGAFDSPQAAAAAKRTGLT
ncbi:MAG: hypothetical protein ACREMI_07415, partial [Gemmatimonadales bacterium]